MKNTAATQTDDQCIKCHKVIRDFRSVHFLPYGGVKCNNQTACSKRVAAAKATK